MAIPSNQEKETNKNKQRKKNSKIKIYIKIMFPIISYLKPSQSWSLNLSK